MGNSHKKEIEKAKREYEEAFDYFRKLADECVSVFGPGETTFKPKLKTAEDLGKLNEAYAKTNEALKKWFDLITTLKRTF